MRHPVASAFDSQPGGGKLRSSRRPLRRATRRGGSLSMNFRCKMSRTSAGLWSVRHASADTGTVEVTAASRAQALEKMRAELRYRLELCPCTGEQYKDIEIDLIEEGGV